MKKKICQLNEKLASLSLRNTHAEVVPACLIRYEAVGANSNTNKMTPWFRALSLNAVTVVDLNESLSTPSYIALPWINTGSNITEQINYIYCSNKCDA